MDGHRDTDSRGSLILLAARFGMSGSPLRACIVQPLSRGEQALKRRLKRWRTHAATGASMEAKAQATRRQTPATAGILR
jgi:hypothetical protein